MSEKKQFMIVFLVIIVFSIVLLLVLNFYKNRRIDSLKETGTQTIAFYSYNASRPGTTTYKYKFVVENKEYFANSGKYFKANDKSPLKEIPVIVAYEKSNPDNNIILPEEIFRYKGYKICWVHKRGEIYEAELDKHMD